MNAAKTIIGILLCLTGAVWLLFMLAMIYSEWHPFRQNDWVPFFVSLSIGIVTFGVGVILLLKTRR